VAAVLHRDRPEQPYGSRQPRPSARPVGVRNPARRSCRRIRPTNPPIGAYVAMIAKPPAVVQRTKKSLHTRWANSLGCNAKRTDRAARGGSMALLQSFDPPAFLDDFDGITGQRQAWHGFVSRCFAVSIAAETAKVKRSDGSLGVVQFYTLRQRAASGAAPSSALVSSRQRCARRVNGSSRPAVATSSFPPYRHCATS